MTGKIERVSVSSTGERANGRSEGTAAISADGRFVAFSSDATNLVAGDQDKTFGIFVRDRKAGTTTLISVAP